MEEMIKIATLLFWASTKFMVAIGLGYLFKYGVLQSIAITTTGGMIGVTFFTYLEELALMLPFLNPQQPQSGIKINKKMRTIVHIKNSFGIYGIAFLTPIFLTVPIGTVMAHLLGESKTRVFAAMLIAFLFWSTIFFSLYYFLGIDLYSFATGWLSQLL